MDTSKKNTDMGTGFSREVSGSSLSNNKGTNRFRWNMRHSGPWDKDPKKAFLNGPLVAPGKYVAQLNIEGKTYTNKFQILMDPNVKKSGIRISNVKAQEKLALQVRSLLDESKIMAHKLKDVEDGSMLIIKKALVTNKGPYPQPMLIDQARYLGSMLDRSDQQPGEDAYTRFEELNEQFRLLKKSYNELND